MRRSRGALRANVLAGSGLFHRQIDTCWLSDSLIEWRTAQGEPDMQEHQRMAISDSLMEFPTGNLVRLKLQHDPG